MRRCRPGPPAGETSAPMMPSFVQCVRWDFVAPVKRMTSAKLRADIEREIGRAAYAVPQENVFVAIPIRYAQRIRAKVLQQFTQAKRPVSPDVFVERNGRLVPLT